MIERRSFSQYGEDLILWDFFAAKADGFFVEIGANHPTALSNSWFFEQRGWRGILVEPLPERCRELRQVRHRSQIIEAALSSPNNRGTAVFRIAEAHELSGLRPKPEVKCLGEVTVVVETLDDVLAAAGNPRIDFISIDVEGTEVDVLRGFSLERHRPTVLLVEDHWRDSTLHHHLSHRGYRIIRRTGVNSWYVPFDSRAIPATLLGALQTSVHARYTFARRGFRNRLKSLLAGHRHPANESSRM